MADQQKVYMVFEVGSKTRFPIPFAKRESAEAWARKKGYKEGEFEVDGFRVRP